MEMVRYKACKVCGVSKPLNLLPFNGDRDRYTDDSGRLWQGARCAGCHLEAIRENRKVNGQLRIDVATYPTLKKGRDAERTAKAFLESLNYEDVRLNRGIGPDITYAGPDRRYTVEVKAAYLKKNQYWIGGVSPNRVNDDHIAIVFPNGSVFFEPMLSHTSKIKTPTGSRNVTSLAIKEVA